MAVAGVSDASWRQDEAYQYLYAAERPMFAWEWLRRTEQYRHAWARARHSTAADRHRSAHLFGLADLVPPTQSAAEARPVWLIERDPHVLVAAVAGSEAQSEDRLDIRLLGDRLLVILDERDVEHWRLEIGGRAIRIDVHEGTLLGGPTLLTFLMTGLASLGPKLTTLDHLVGNGPASKRSANVTRARRAARWIGELRTADALADGAVQHEIARVLYATAVPPDLWRRQGDSYRSRVKRLVRIARSRLRDPLTADWFR